MGVRVAQPSISTDKQPDSGRHVQVARIGKRTLDLDAGTVRLQNRTNDSTYKLSPEGLQRWKDYMFGNTRQGGGGKDQFVRLTGLFPTKKGNYIGRVKTDQFNAVFKLMQDANAINGTLNFIIAPNKQTQKPELFVVVGQEYNPQAAAPAAPAGPFGAPVAPAPAAAPAANVFGNVPAAPPAQPQQQRAVQFGAVETPKDDFDSLLENL